MNYFGRVAAVATLVSALATGASALTVTQNFGPFFDVDDAGGTSFNFNVSDTGTITDLDIMLTVEEPAVGGGGIAFEIDLEITLSHLGTSVLFSDNLNFDPFNTVSATALFDDDGGGVTPSNPLSAFDGLEASGVWTISFLDTAVSGEHDVAFGSLIMEIQPSEVPIPATGLLLLGGLAAGGFVARRRKG